MKVHILTPGIKSQKSFTFLYPVIFNERRLRNLGISVAYFNTAQEAIFDCDVFVIDIEYFKQMLRGHSQKRDPEKYRRLLETVARRKNEELPLFRRKAAAIILIDSTASSGNIENDYFPYIDLYCKGQLLKDRELYKQSFIRGGRIYCHYYHEKFDIQDNLPEFSLPLSDEEIAKLRIHWNTGLANHSLHKAHFRRLQEFAQWRPFFRYSKVFHTPSKNRPRDICCRIFTHTNNFPTARFQREQVKQLLNHNTSTDMISLSDYFKEMRHSKVSISPFGLGEICYRDYEIFICGSLLFKADMSHLETFPNFYSDGETYRSYQWDLSGFKENLAETLDNYHQYVDVARAGQERYKQFIATEKGYEEFCLHFKRLLNEAINQ